MILGLFLNSVHVVCLRYVSLIHYRIHLLYFCHGKVCIRAKWPIRPELIPAFVAWSDWEYFSSPLDGMLVHHRVTAPPLPPPPSIKFAGAHLYTWIERGTVRVNCLAQEHNTMSSVRAQTRTAPSGVERTNHEATAPPNIFAIQEDIYRSSEQKRSQPYYKILQCKFPFLIITLITVEPRFNEVAWDRPNLFVKWRVRYIENLDITNLRETTKMFVISRS